MKTKMRRNFSGAFRAEDLGGGAWRLVRSDSRGVEVFLRGAESAAANSLGAASLVDLGVEWRTDSVLLTMMSSGTVRTVRASSVIVHEPLEHLYENLPLVNLDAKAQRFWRRVFRLIRIPGGRLLLGFVARSNRNVS